jgi:hypothetical protein
MSEMADLDGQVRQAVEDVFGVYQIYNLQSAGGLELAKERVYSILSELISETLG